MPKTVKQIQAMLEETEAMYGENTTITIETRAREKFQRIPSGGFDWEAHVTLIIYEDE